MKLVDVHAHLDHALFKNEMGGIIERAKKAGFHRVVKTRLDCLIGIPNIVDHCEDILQREDKKLLLTQQTGLDMRCGDCFLYGNLAIMQEI